MGVDDQLAVCQLVCLAAADCLADRYNRVE